MNQTNLKALITSVFTYTSCIINLCNLIHNLKWNIRQWHGILSWEPNRSFSLTVCFCWVISIILAGFLAQMSAFKQNHWYKQACQMLKIYRSFWAMSHTVALNSQTRPVFLANRFTLQALCQSNAVHTVEEDGRQHSTAHQLIVQRTRELGFPSDRCHICFHKCLVLPLSTTC